jgi:N-acetylmuramoyl-L-alanine amidase
MRLRCTALLVCVLLAMPAAEVWAQSSAQALYNSALARERTVRDAASKATLAEIRSAVSAYENIVRRFPRSGYCDNALWQGGNLAVLAFERFGQEADRRTAVRLLRLLRSEYPSSSLAARVPSAVRMAENARHTPPAPARAEVPPPAARPPAPPPAEPQARATIKDITRGPIPGGMRVTIEMDQETTYHAERLDGPARVFFDLHGTDTVGALRDASFSFEDDIVREIRLGRHPQQVTRVVLDMQGVADYSVFTLYEPFRLVVDFRATPSGAAGTSGAQPAPEGPAAPVPAPPAAPPASIVTNLPPAATPALETLPTRPAPVAAPDVPTANADGKYSLARQLGLGISRIVIDAGHGGHDPGTIANGLRESEIVLDVAKRLAALLRKEGMEVVMTRDADKFVELEERTAIANREGADLFLSIHVNSARNVQARGVETYFLNFATNPEAEAVAARENATSSRKMHHLPDIVRAIALNNKINESRDFADAVQRAMIQGMTARNRQVTDRGVKQAPFVVLIGAEMPSVLAEISFVTNKADASMLKTAAYRQQIAESLFAGIKRYQQSVKKMRAPSTTTSAR